MTKILIITVILGIFAILVIPISGSIENENVQTENVQVLQTIPQDSSNSNSGFEYNVTIFPNNQEESIHGIITDNSEINNAIFDVYNSAIFYNWNEGDSYHSNPYGFSGSSSWAPQSQLPWDTAMATVAISYSNDERFFQPYLNWAYWVDTNPYRNDPDIYGVFLGAPDGGNSIPNDRLKTTALPLFAWGIKNYYYSTNNLSFIRYMLPYLDNYDKWYMKNRDPLGINVVTVGAKGLDLQHASWEYLDYSSYVDHAKYEPMTGLINIYLVGQSSFLAKQAEDIALLYDISASEYEKVGDTSNATKERNNASNYTNLWQTRCNAINNIFLKSDGMYYDTYIRTNESIGHKYIGGLWVLFSGCPNQSQAATLVSNHILNTSEFWTNYPIPSIAKSDPDYDTVDSHKWGGNNWRGQSWWSTNLIVSEGLRRYGYFKEAKELARRTLEAKTNSWNGWTPVFFNPDNGGIWGNCPGDHELFSSGQIPLYITNFYGVESNFYIINASDLIGSGKILKTYPISIDYTNNSDIMIIKKKHGGNMTIILPQNWSNTSYIKIFTNKIRVNYTFSNSKLDFDVASNETYFITYNFSKNDLVYYEKNLIFDKLQKKDLSCLGSSSINNSGSGGGGGGGVVTDEDLKNVNNYESKEGNLLAGKEVRFDFNKMNTGIFYTIVKGKENEYDVTIRVENLKAQPKKATNPAPNVVYLYTNILSGTKKMESAKIGFKVSNTWLENNNVDRNTIKMYRLIDGNWIVLDTKLTGNDAENTIYEATTTGFSKFAISGETIPVPTENVVAPTPVPTPIPTETPANVSVPAVVKTPKSPGFDTLMSILVISGIVYMIRRKKIKFSSYIFW